MRLDSFPERRYCSWLGCHVLVCFVCGVELYFVYEAFLLERPHPQSAGTVKSQRRVANNYIPFTRELAYFADATT